MTPMGEWGALAGALTSAPAPRSPWQAGACGGGGCPGLVGERQHQPQHREHPEHPVFHQQHGLGPQRLSTPPDLPSAVHPASRPLRVLLISGRTSVECLGVPLPHPQGTFKPNGPGRRLLGPLRDATALKCPGLCHSNKELAPRKAGQEEN